MKKIIPLKVVEKQNEQVSRELGIKIIKGRKSDMHKVGIHRLHPDAYELADALEQADRDGFRTIYVYDKRSWK